MPNLHADQSAINVDATTQRLLKRQLDGRVCPLPRPSLVLTYDSAMAALAGAAHYIEEGHLVRAYEANADPEDFTWKVDVWAVADE